MIAASISFAFKSVPAVANKVHSRDDTMPKTEKGLQLLLWSLGVRASKNKVQSL